ncbi:MAG: aspartate aminotransferase family protein [Betaproteobacteria bacterium]|nr:aspartate aminotransferase family protein [Betaproteobacteria bacterium]
MNSLMNTVTRLPVRFTRGEGVWLWDDQGRKYLDGFSGIAVNTLGHAHPRFTRVLQEQVSRLIHVSNYFQIGELEKLADKLVSVGGMENAFFCNSGCEANEAAIKLARLYGHQRGVDNPAIIVMENAFHGRTLATLSATGNRKAQAGFEPLVTGFVRVPLNDIASVRQIAASNRNVVAVLLEPIQGEGGINVSTVEYLRALRDICNQQNWLFMLDEVQCGIGRTGPWFVYQHANVLPDVLTLAKGLGGGVPIGVCLARGVAAQVFKPGNHGTTFGGNPLACAAALAVLEIVESEKLRENAEAMGRVIRDALAREFAGNKGVVEIRGRGLMIGMELDRPCYELMAQALDVGLLINVTTDNVIRIVPSLIISDAEAREIVTRLAPLVHAILAKPCEVKSAKG